jgi:lipopolysaccharide transport system ATP-binding protein
MSSEYAIEVNNLNKCYQIYEKPSDRLKQMFFRGRRKYFKEFWALRDVSFGLRKGETVGIIGRNGSGKSTLLQMICGTLNPTSGDIKVNGRIAALLELGAGFNPEFSGVENVYMAAALYGLSKLEIEHRFESIAEFADIGDHIFQPIKTYSSGMYVRLAFAVIAHVDADILVIDEALAVGDAFFTQKCMRFLRGFMSKGTVLFVSHDTASVRSLCNRAVWINKGQVLEIGLPKDVCEHYLEEFFAANQGEHLKSSIASTRKLEVNLVRRDQRQDFINSTNLRNDIKVFHFQQDAPSFGKRQAEIVDVAFQDNEGKPFSWVIGGELVILKIRALSIGRLASPIIGFYIKDRLGQTLFGDNTYLSYITNPVPSLPGNELVAEFSFQMPRLSVGDYSICAAIADGTQSDHIQHHWIHDALLFKSESTSTEAGLMGIPMTNIKLNNLG